MSGVNLSIHVEDGDEITARYHPERVVTNPRYSLDVPAALHVRIGDDVSVWGAPEVVLRKLCDALARAREAEADSQAVVTDLGGAA